MKRLTTALAIVGVLSSGAARAAEKPKMIAVVDHSDNCTASVAAEGNESIVATIVSLLIGTAVKAGVKGLGKAMSKAGADKEIHIEGEATSYFYRGELGDTPKIKRLYRCIRVAAGVKGGDGPPVGAGPGAPVISSYGRTWLVKDEVGFKNAPNLYMETRMRLSLDRSAFQMVPVSAWVGKPLQGKPDRDLVVTFSIIAPAAGADGEALATRSFALKRVKEGPVGEAELAALASDWIPLPALPEVASARFDAAVARKADIKALEKTLVDLKAPPKPAAKPAKPGAADAGEPPLTAKEVQERLDKLKAVSSKDETDLAFMMPVTFRVDVHETADGNKLLAAIGGFLTDNADAISGPIVNKLDPAKRREAAIAAADSELTLRAAALEAIDAWQTTEASADATALSKQIKKLAAQGACRKLEEADYEDVACLTLN